MGRLIDEDALILRLRNESVMPISKMLLNDEHRWFLKLEDMIKTQPTTYNVEKVLEELEVLHELVNDNQRLAVSQAISIVRKGGAE